MSRIPKESLLKRIGRGLATVTDEIVETFNPKAGVQRKMTRRAGEYLAKRHERRLRMLAEDIEFPNSTGGGGGFDSGNRGRLDATWLYGRLHPDSAIEESIVEMRAKSNSAYKNHELFAGHVLRRRQRVAGLGITIRPQIVPVEGRIDKSQAEAWNKLLRETFERWAHAAGGPGMPLYMQQRIAVTHIEKDGVAWAQFGDVSSRDPRIPIDLRVKMIHPNRIETPAEEVMNPRIRMGVKYDANDDFAGAYVRTAHPDDTKKFELDYEFVPAFFDNGLPRLVKVCDLHEAEQSIGYPQGQVMLRRCKNIDEYGEAELERNIIAACYSGFAVGGDTDLSGMAAGAASHTDSSGRLIQELAPGRFEYVPDADSVVFSNPPGPQAAFAPFVEHEARMAAAGVGTTHEMMTGNWRDISYSGGKLIWIDEQGPIDCMQLDLIELFLLPLWQNFVSRCINGGLVDVLPTRYRSDPHIFERCKFVVPKRPSIDPARERAAAHSDIAAGIIPHSDEVEQMNGRPAEEVYEDILANQAQLEMLGLSLDSLKAGGGTPLGGTNPDAQKGSEGERKRREVGAGK